MKHQNALPLIILLGLLVLGVFSEEIVSYLDPETPSEALELELSGRKSAAPEDWEAVEELCGSGTVTKHQERSTKNTKFHEPRP